MAGDAEVGPFRPMEVGFGTKAAPFNTTRDMVLMLLPSR